MDDDLRQAERAWRSRPDDQPALARWIDARYRAGLPVDHELLERQVHPARTLELPMACRVSALATDGSVTSHELEPGAAVCLPPHTRLWVEPRGATPDSLRALARSALPPGTVVCLEGAGLSGTTGLAAVLEGAPWTHVEAELGLDLGVLEQVARLPRLASLYLTRWNDAAPALSSADLAPLSRAPMLSSLWLGCARVAPGALAAPAGAALRELAVAELPPDPSPPVPVDDELEGLARAAPQLRRLDLGSYRACGDRGARALGRSARHLEALSLGPSPELSDEGVAALGELPLRELTLDASGLTDASARLLARLPLRELAVWSSSFSADGLRALGAGAAELSLGLRGHAQLPGLPGVGERLVELSLQLQDSSRDADLEPLRGARALRELRVWWAWDGVARDGWLQHLTASDRLTRLQLARPALSAEGARALLALPLRELEIFGAPPRDVDQGPLELALRRLADHPTLEQLRIVSCPACSDEVLLAFAAAPSLRRLELRSCPGVTPRGVERLIAATEGRLRVDSHA